MELRKILESKNADELRSICRKLKIPNFSKKTKPQLVKLLLEHQNIVSTYLKPSIRTKIKNNGAYIALASLLLGIFLLGIKFWPTSIKKDSIEVPVSIISQFHSSNYISLSSVNRFSDYSDNFRNYDFSLNNIDYPLQSSNVYVGLENEFGVKFPKFDLDPNKIYISPQDAIENAFWCWMTNFPQEYNVNNVKSTPTITGTKLSANSEGWDSPNVKFLPIISESNDLINLNKLMVQVPKSGKLKLGENQFIIETNVSTIMITIEKNGVSGFNNSRYGFSKKIFELFKLEGTGRLSVYNYIIRMNFERKSNLFRRKQGDKEYAWFKRLKENLEKDFSFEILKLKLLEIE